MHRLRLIVFLLVAAAFGGLALLEFLYFPGRSQRALREALEAKAVAVAELTAYSVVTALEFDDRAVVREYLTGAARDRDLLHVAVFDAKGDVFEAIVRKGVLVNREFSTASRTTVREVDGDLHVVTPVRPGKPHPSVSVSYSQAGIRAQSRENERTALEIALAIAGLGMAVAYWIVVLSQRHHTTELARERAEATSKAKSDFVARVSHEIRTPLNGVLGIADLLLRTDLGARQRQLVRTLQRSGRHLLGVINDILDLSKVEVGELELRAERVDLANVAEDAAELVAAQVKSGVELVTRLDDALPKAASADAQRLLQVFTNLLGNAVKFTSSGEIRLAATVTGGGEGRVRVRFSVKDTGIGISPAAQERLFQSFYQVADSSRNYGGTGLGLSISQELVKRMGGTIEVESETGKGSEFWFELDLEVLEPAVPAGRALAGLSALLVAGPVQRREIGLMMKEFGVEWREVDTASAVVPALETSSVDVVILDTSVEGADATLAQAWLERWPALRVLLLSRSVDYVEGGEPGTESLVKPVRKEAFYRAFGALVGRIGASSSSSGAGLRGPRERRSFAPARGTVLAAEDNPTNQEVLRALLDELGYALDIHRNGLEVIRAFEAGARRYALVLMDCQMPELDGYEAARRLRAIEAREGRPRLPILAITAGTPAEIRGDVLAAGMDDVLPKPIGLESLRGALTRWCGSSDEVVLDAARTSELLRLQTPARPHFVRDLVTRFLLDADPLVDRLNTAATERDAEELRTAAHALKGSSRNLGAKLLSAVCEALERQASEGRLDGAEAGVARVTVELRRARVELERLLPG